MELFQSAGKWNVLSTLGLLEHTLILCNILLTLCAFHNSFPLEGGKRKLDQGLVFFLKFYASTLLKNQRDINKQNITSYCSRCLPDTQGSFY